jgi:hypothetical protein
LKRADSTASAPQLKWLMGSLRSWSQMSTPAPAVAKMRRCQWWSSPLHGRRGGRLLAPLLARLQHARLAQACILCTAWLSRLPWLSPCCLTPPPPPPGGGGGRGVPWQSTVNSSASRVQRLA